MRRALIDRQTTETQISLGIGLDGKGTYRVRTGIRFLDHMLELVARHGAFDLTVDAQGDLDVDQHHTVEDLGIAFGEAVSKALGDRKGINRAGYFVMPMDETLAVAAIDLGGRPHAVVDLQVKVVRVGDLQVELVHDFFEGFAIGARANVHLKVHVRPLEPPQDRSGVQGIRASAARGLRERQAPGEDAAQHQGAAVIALIDYKAGNLTSVKKALATLGADVIVPATAASSATCKASSCPASDISAPRAHSTSRGSTPSSNASAKDGRCSASVSACSGCSKAATKRPTALASDCWPVAAIAWARVARIEVRLQPDQIKVPHVGWNSIQIQRDNASIVNGVANASQVYFTHSYVAPVTDDAVAVAEHGEPFAAVVQHGQISGVQFHPEKSGDVGLRILRNFLELAG